jgi:diacylglycerol O-acyltransferase
VSTVEERMLHSDAFAWYMEKDPVLRSTVVAIVRLEESPDWATLRFRIDRLTRLAPHLRMRVQEPPLRVRPPRWIVDESFDLDYHLRRMKVAAPAGWQQVLEFARTAAMADFDRGRPLWEFTVLEGLRGGGAALVAKLHHSLTDGIGGVQLVALVVDPSPDGVQPTELPSAPRGHHVSSAALAAHTPEDGRAELAGLVRRGARTLLRGMNHVARHPLRAVATGMRAAVSVGRFVAPVNRPASPLFGERRTARRLATIDVSLDALHGAAQSGGCHLNDAYLAAITEGIRRYHDKFGSPLGHIRMTVPVSLRSKDDAVGGNRITLIRIKVRTTPMKALDRMQHIAEVMRRWRHEPALDHAQGIAAGLNLMPRAYLSGVLKRVEAVASDVPGLPKPVWLAGAKVSACYGFGPTIGAAMNCTLMSYSGTCNVGVNIDTNAVEDPDLMINCLEAAFTEVLSLDAHRATTGALATRCQTG